MMMMMMTMRLLLNSSSSSPQHHSQTDAVSAISMSNWQISPSDEKRGFHYRLTTVVAATQRIRQMGSAMPVRARAEYDSVDRRDGK